MSENAVPAPSGLRDRGVLLWNEVSTEFDLRADELRVLEDACREADLIDALADALDREELVVIGSKGQPVVNPLVSELRQHRATLAALFRQLRLPDDGDTPEARSTQAREAANARWSRRGAA